MLHLQTFHLESSRCQIYYIFEKFGGNIKDIKGYKNSLLQNLMSLMHLSFWLSLSVFPEHKSK